MSSPFGTVAMTCAVLCLGACSRSESAAPAKPHVTTYVLGSPARDGDHVVCCFTISDAEARDAGLPLGHCMCEETSSSICQDYAIGIPGVSKPTWTLVQSCPSEGP
jgi:hypothetical protein